LNITIEPLLYHFHIKFIVVGATCPFIDSEDLERFGLAEMIDHRAGRTAFERTYFQNFRDPLIRRNGQPIWPVLREPIYSKLVLIIHYRCALMAKIGAVSKRGSQE